MIPLTIKLKTNFKFTEFRINYLYFIIETRVIKSSQWGCFSNDWLQSSLTPSPIKTKKHRRDWKKNSKKLYPSSHIWFDLRNQGFNPTIINEQLFRKIDKILTFFINPTPARKRYQPHKKNNKKSHLTPSFVHGHYNIATLKKYIFK